MQRFFLPLRGTVNIISIVLIAGIVLALVGAVYTWSGPLINKSETRTLFQTSSTFALALNQQLIDIANSGGGEKNLDIPLGAIEVIPYQSPDPRNNSIIFRFPLSQPLALNSSKTYLGGSSFLDVSNTTLGIFGESSPSIVSLEVQTLGTSYEAIIQIYFRPLLSKTTGKKRVIALNEGSIQKLTGKSKITFAFDENIQDSIDPQTTLTKLQVFVV